MASIFIGDWIYKFVSYYKYKQKQPLKGALEKKCSWNSKTVSNNLKSSYNPWKIGVKNSFLVKLQACMLIAGNFISKWFYLDFKNTVLSPTPPSCSPLSWLKSQHLWKPC